MKKLIFLSVLFLFISIMAIAQLPHAFTYQAVAKDNSGTPLVNQQIEVRISFRQGTPTGTEIYAEEHTVTTNNTGYFSLYAGNGTPTLNTFTAIDWSNGLHYMETKLKITPSSAFVSVGTSPVLTVPIAQHSKEADTAKFADKVGRNAHSFGDNVFLGDSAGISNTSGQKNVFLGTDAGVANTTGNWNTYIGYLAGKFNATGKHNVFIGEGAGRYNTSDENVFLGVSAGDFNINGMRNTFIGVSSGRWSTGSSNVFLGHDAGITETGSYRLHIETTANPNNVLIYGEFDNRRVAINGKNTNGQTFYVNGTAGGNSSWSNSSDRRLKTNIQTVSNPLAKVLQLRGVTYHWKDGREKGNRLGFIAQEVEKIMPEVVNTEGDYYTMQYAPLTAVLVEAVKEQQTQIEAQQEEITALKQQVAKTDELAAQLATLQEQVSQLLEVKGKESE